MHQKKVPAINRPQPKLLPAVETVTVASAGGVLFSLIGVPMGWMLGALTFGLCWKAFLGRPLHLPRWIYNLALTALSYSMGLSFTMDSLRSITGQIHFLLLATILMILFGMIAAAFVAKCSSISAESSVLGSIPGGVVQMVELSREIRGAEPTVVAVMQMCRFLGVIFIVPFAVTHFLAGGAMSETDLRNIRETLPGNAGSTASFAMLLLLPISACLAGRLRVPTPWMIGPLVTTIVLVAGGWELPRPTTETMNVTQILLGTGLALSFSVELLREVIQILHWILMGVGLTLVLAAVLAYILSLASSLDPVTAFLAVSPGGMAEMGATALTMGADVPTITAYHLFRLLFILLVCPYLLKVGFRLWMKRTERRISSRNPESQEKRAGSYLMTLNLHKIFYVNFDIIPFARSNSAQPDV